MENKYNNDAIIGNGKILAGYSKNGELLRMCYPNVDYKNNINFFHVGVKINDSAIIYLHDDINNHYNQSYIEDTNILNTKIYNSYFNLEIQATDFCAIKKDVIFKQYILKNNNTIDMNIDFLLHSELESSNANEVSARIFNDALIQYSYDYSFAIFSNDKITSKQIHNSKENIRSGVIGRKDYIGMSNDSSISYSFGILKPGEEKKICIYIYAKENDKSESFEEIANEIDEIRKIDIEKEYNQVKKYWEKYIQKHYLLKGKEFDENIYKIYKRSILLFPLLTNKKTGGIIAGMEVDENKKYSGGYGYSWPRDAVFITKALDLLGMTEEAEKFYNVFCKKTQSKNGMWEQRFFSDGRLAPCWGYQIDETASVIYGIYNHYESVKDEKFLKNNLKMCEKALEFLIKYIKNLLGIEEIDIVKKELLEKYENKDEMHKKVSYDIWEMNEGVHLYSLASIYAAFDSMIKIYDILKEEYKNNRIKLEKIEKLKTELDKYKIVIKKYIKDNLVNDKQKVLLRNTTDEKTDISILGAVVPFGVFEANEKMIKNTVEKINMTLRTYTGGYLRFESDGYMGGNNPWPIATLWMALYYYKIGDIENTHKCLNFVCNTSSKHGFLAEQIDNNTLKPNWVIGLGWSHAMFIIILQALEENI